MKKVIFLILPILLVAASCKKYEEGPALSLRSKKQRAMNSWVIGQVFETPVGGAKVDKTTDYKNYYYNYNMILSDNDQYGVTYSILNLLPYSETGTWVFAQAKEKIIFTNSNPNQGPSIGTVWIILRLKNDELWMTTEKSNGTIVEAHFVTQ